MHAITKESEATLNVAGAVKPCKCVQKYKKKKKLFKPYVWGKVTKLDLI